MYLPVVAQLFFRHFDVRLNFFVPGLPHMKQCIYIMSALITQLHQTSETELLL